MSEPADSPISPARQDSDDPPSVRCFDCDEAGFDCGRHGGQR